MPIYFATQPQAITVPWRLLVLTSTGVLLGTFWGVRFLRLIPERVFRRAVSALIALLGAATLIQTLAK